MNYSAVSPAPVRLLRRFIRALFFLLLLPIVLTAQSTQLSDSQLHDYLKSLLTEYYTGKMVYAKVAIPDTERGLSIIDGRLEAAPAPSQAASAKPGAALVIRQLKFNSKNIEVQFEGNDAANENLAIPIGEPQRLTRSSGPRHAPRINLRFSRAIATSDLTIPNINRLLSAAVDISALIPKTAEQLTATDGAAATQPKPADAAMLAERAANAQGIPTATMVADLEGARAEISELTIECATAPARIYIDGAYSGWAPRTIRLLSGIHSILIVSEGYAMWEQKFFVPGGKASRVQVELKRAGQ
jgi:hypothetical protein